MMVRLLILMVSVGMLCPNAVIIAEQLYVSLDFISPCMMYWYYRLYVWLLTGFWLDIGFIDNFNTPLETTRNYSAVTNLHTSQITAAPAKPFPACCVFSNRSLAAVSNSGDSSASCAHIITVQQISCNWTFVKCPLNCSAISSQSSFTSRCLVTTLDNSYSSVTFSVDVSL
jgi:hypothetical protein